MAYGIDDAMQGVGSYFAAQQQEEQIRQAMAQQQAMYNQSRGDQAPWMQAGQQGLQSLMQMVNGGYDYNQLANDPGYQFRMQQGQQALERSAAARGGLNSGGFMKGLAGYSQGLASDAFGQRFNRLSSIAGMGQNSAQNLGQLGQGYSNSMSSLYGAMGNAQAAAIMGPTNAGAAGVRSAGNIGMMAMGNPMGMMGGGGFGGGVGGGAGAIPSQGFSGYGSGIGGMGGGL